MALLSLFLRLRSSSSKTTKTRPFLLTAHRLKKPFSTSPCLLQQPDPGSPLPTPASPLPLPQPPPDPRPSLSARMSFVFDQMGAIDRLRGAKDEALQNIHAWRQNKQQQPGGTGGGGDVSGIGLSVSSGAVEGGKEGEGAVKVEDRNNVFKKEVELVHPWPEWIELMERLAQQNYFDHRRFDEDRIVKDLPIDLSGIADVGFDFTRDWTAVRTACVNFGRDRFDILRSLSKKDLQILVGNGCPSTDSKVVFSAKLLRKHTHLDEGDVCSSCSLRSSCGRGYLLTRNEDEARTLDVLRILLTFGFDSITGSVENKVLMKIKSVKTVARKMIHEVVKLSAVPIDPNLPPPVIKKPPPKVKQPPPPPKKRVGRDDIEMKKGDWLCPKCDFMNFAKNIVCMRCDAKRPKRQLLPGEWECPECNFLNYRRNMACFHCDHKRPPDVFMENQMQLRQQGPRTRLERATRMSSVSDAWNFDFDDNESDGADVAAFEFADAPRMSEDSSLDGPPQRGIARGFEDDTTEINKIPRIHERGRYFSELDERKPSSHAPRTGFDDFDDDDVDSYVLDDQPNNPIPEVSAKNFSKFESSAESEDFDDYSKPRRVLKTSLSGSEDDGARDFYSDSDLLDHPRQKASHIVDSRQRIRGRGRGGNSLDRGICFGSDGDLELDSDFDDDVDRVSKQRSNRQQISGRRGPERRRSYDSEDRLFNGSRSDRDDSLHSSKNKIRVNKGSPNRRGISFRGRDQPNSPRIAQFRTDDRMSGRRNSFGNPDDDWAFRGSHRNNRGTHAHGYGAQRRKDEICDLRSFDRPRQREGFEYGQGRSNQFNDKSRCVDNDRPHRRVIER